MIKSVSLKNFQSHEESKFDFHERINIITGRSDSGKSAIIRAINWIVNNRPSGDSFRSRWGGDTIAEIQINSGSIRRVKTKTKNSYESDRSGSFQSFKTDVPEDIQKELNFSDINIQSQLDGPFLLSLGSGEVTRYINEIVNLDSIDKILSKAEAIKRKHKNDLEYNRELLNDKVKELDRYENLDEYEAKVKKTNEYYEKSKELLTKVNSINIKIDTIKEISKEIESRKQTEKLLQKEVDVLVFIHDKKELLKKKKTELKNLQGLINNINRANNKIKSMQKIDINILTKANNLYIEFEEKSDKLSRIKNIIDKYKKTDSRIEILKVKNEKLHAELDQIMPDECPICGGEIEKG